MLDSKIKLTSKSAFWLANRNNNKNARTRRNKGVKGQWQVPPLGIVPRNMGATWDRMRTRLQYNFMGVVSATGTDYASQRFAPTNVYDVNPTLGSTAAVGFTEWAAFYRFYRLVQATIIVDFVNNEAIAETVCIMPFNNDPGANLNWLPYCGYNKYKLLSLAPATGSSSGRLTMTCTTDSFAGAANSGTIDSYCAATSGSPSNNWWFLVGSNTDGTAAGTTLGVTICVQVKMVVDFFERQGLQG